MRIRKLTITNFMGVEAREIDVPPGGFVAMGACGTGKTTVLHAIRSALTAQRIAPSAIRNGADRAEILVDLDDVTVKRVITPKSSSLSVERAGMAAKKPQTFITGLVGSSPLDPIGFYLKNEKERVAALMEALPLTVTREELREFAPDIEDDFDVSGHGLDVLARAHKRYYDARTEANKDAKDARATAERLKVEAAELAANVSPGPLVPIEEAKAAQTAAERELVAIEARENEAKLAVERTAGQRARIEGLRVDAGIARDNAGEVVSVAPLSEAADAAKAAVDALEAQLTEAKAKHAAARDALDAATQRNALAQRALDAAADLERQADALAAVLDAGLAPAPTEAEIATAREALATARASHERATAQAVAMAAVAAVEKADVLATGFEAEARDLDVIVKRLAKDAPEKLLAKSNGIPGLSIDGDKIRLDGKVLDDLCGAEQLEFAVELARRANAKSKIIVADGLERLDHKRMEAFIRMATKGGYQLIATRVTDSEAVEIVALETDDESAAAAQ